MKTKIFVAKAENVESVQAGHMATGAFEKYVLGNVNLGGHPTESMSIVIATLEKGVSGGRHKHSSEEFFYIMEGKGKAYLGEKEVILEPGVLMYAPAEMPHEFINTGTEPLVLIAALSKAEYTTTKL
jgi:quercetin dioxygenase-like cupin family protein